MIPILSATLTLYILAVVEKGSKSAQEGGKIDELGHNSLHGGRKGKNAKTSNFSHR
jgi:hypothetical protein